MTSAEYLKSAACIVIVLILLYRYLKDNKAIVSLLFIAFALRYYSIPLIGPTIDVLYLFSIAISSIELVFFLSGKFRVSKGKLMLFCVPFIIFLLYLFVYTFQSNHYLSNFNPLFWYLKTCGNYIKTFLPYFVIGISVKRNVNEIGKDEVLRTVLKVATFSCVVSVFQIFCFVVFYHQGTLLQLIGLKGGYDYQYSVGNLNLVRVQAFFYEPKSMAAFLGLAVPVAFYFKKKWSAVLFTLVGFLTLSQTFVVILLAAVIIFIFLKKIQSVRASILWATGIILAFFFSVSTLKTFLLENYATQEETIAYKIFLDRALQRYSVGDSANDNEFLGIPLQPDIELPAVNFLRDNQLFLLTGFGPGNYNAIPLKYFVSQWNINAIEEGNFKGHFDMGWIYLIAEFGLLFFVPVFLELTRIHYTGFVSSYYAFLWLVFFFHRIDFLLIAFFCLLFYKNQNHRENFYSNNILQPSKVY